MRKKSCICLEKVYFTANEQEELYMFRKGIPPESKMGSICLEKVYLPTNPQIIIKMILIILIKI